jgi:hypothetical protein
MFPKLYLNAMIRNTKMHNIFNIVEIWTRMECNKYIHIKNYENIYLSFSFDFSKSDESKKIKMWHL